MRDRPRDSGRGVLRRPIRPDLRPAGRGGFAVVVVVFLLFAVAIAAAVGYQVVQLEGELATQHRDATRARTVAQAGLERYLGEHLGVPADSVVYLVSGDTAMITTRKVAEVDSVTDLYLIRSAGRVADVRWGGAPASRTVSQYALLHKDPIGIHAALLAAVNVVQVRNGGQVDGRDQASPTECSVGGAYDQAGIMNLVDVNDSPGGQVWGSPDEIQLADFDAVLDSARLRWDVLQDPSFPVEHDGSPPSWWSLPSDSFPVVRASENLTGDFLWSGQGVLIVPGEFDVGWYFRWEGIVLAGSLDSQLRTFFGGSGIEGMLIGGLDGQQGSVQIRSFDIEYHSCNALAASASLAYFEALEGGWWEDL